MKKKPEQTDKGKLASDPDTSCLVGHALMKSPRHLCCAASIADMLSWATGCIIAKPAFGARSNTRFLDTVGTRASHSIPVEYDVARGRHGEDTKSRCPNKTWNLVSQLNLTHPKCRKEIANNLLHAADSTMVSLELSSRLWLLM